MWPAYALASPAMSQDFLTVKLEELPMTKLNFNGLNTNTIQVVALNEKHIAARKADNAENTALNNEAKVEAYAQLIAEFAGLPRNKSGKNFFATAVSTQIKLDLKEQCALSDATLKRYYENSVAAIKHYGFGNNTTPEAVAQAFADDGITSEGKLVKLVKGEDLPRTVKVAQQIAGKLTVAGNFKEGWSDEEIEEFHSALANALRERQAAREAAEAQAASDKVADEVLAALDAA
jgi:hypothetical protein